MRDITERKQVEDALRESEEFCSILLNNSPISIITMNTDTSIRFVNPAFENLTGFSSKEIVGVKAPHPWCTEEKMEKTRADLEKAIGEGFQKIEELFQKKNGERFWVELTSIPVKESGELNYYLASWVDITERKRAEELIRTQFGLSEALSKVSELDEGLRLCFEAAVKVSGLDCGGVYLLDETSGGLNLVYHCGLSYDFVSIVSRYEAESDNTKLVLSGKPIYTEHLQLEVPLTKIQKHEGLHAIAMIPIHQENRVIGCLNIASHTLDEVPNFARNALEAITTQMGNTIARVMAEEELRIGEARKRAILDASIDQIRLVDTDRRIIWANKTATIKLNIAPEDLEGQYCYDVFAGRDTPCPECPTERVLSSGNIEHTILHTPHLKGIKEETYWDSYAVPVKNESGDIVNIIQITRNITDQRLMEEALHESEKKYRTLADQANDGITIIQKSIIRYVNPRLAEMWGGTVDELIGTPFADYVFPGDRAKVVEQNERHMADEGVTSIYEVDLKRKDGSKAYAELNEAIIIYEGRPASLVFVRDITERKKAEKALKESENRFYELFTNMRSGVAVYEPINDGSDFIVKDYNKAGELISNVNKEQIVGKSVLEVFPGIKKFGLFEVLQRVWKTGESEYHPISLYQDDYLTHWAENYVYKLTSGEIVAVFDDVTERVQAQEELKRSQEKLRSLANYLQSVREEERTIIAREIHDELGQALTGLKMDLSWLAGKVPRDRKELLEKIRAMSGLVSATHKTVQRITTELRPGLLDDLGLAAAIEWQTEEFQSRMGIACKLTIDPEDIVINDKRSTAIFRILQESLSNVSRHAGATRVTVSLKEKDGQIAFRVQDNGKGITKEQLSSNTSFGIMGMRERVHQWGGEVRINGRPGKGTTVAVRM